jgi:hypothetical protein
MCLELMGFGPNAGNQSIELLTSGDQNWGNLVLRQQFGNPLWLHMMGEVLH